MSVESLMIHTCVIVRDTGVDEDPLGNPIKPIEITIYSGICRLVEKQERIWSDEQKMASKVTTYKLLLPPGTAIDGRDRVKNVTLENGSSLDDAFTVQSLIAARGRSCHHVTATLERVG